MIEFLVFMIIDMVIGGGFIAILIKIIKDEKMGKIAKTKPGQASSELVLAIVVVHVLVIFPIWAACIAFGGK